MECSLCSGEMIKDGTTYILNQPAVIAIIKNVPCEKCNRCGEEVFNGKVVKKLEKIVEKLKNVPVEMAVVNFKDKEK